MSVDRPVEEHRFAPTRLSGEVGALLWRPDGARWLVVLGHGAGAGMRHPFLEAMAERLAGLRIATLRYHFPYMERGSRRPDSRPVLQATVRAAVDKATEVAGDLALVAGGKSMGGRMTSLAAAESPLPGVRGLVFLGFPLHSAGRPATERAVHLADVTVPMLFLQGSRDRFAELELLRPICARLPRATLHVVDGGEHSFRMLKSSGRTDDDVRDELGRAVGEWIPGLE